MSAACTAHHQLLLRQKMSGLSADHQATIVQTGIRMKIRRTSPPPTGTGSRQLPVDDVINGTSSLFDVRRKRLKATTKVCGGSVALQNGSIEAHAPRTTGSRLPKRKRPHLKCDVDTGSRGSSSVSTNGSESVNGCRHGCLDSAAGQSQPSSSSSSSSVTSAVSVDGITLNIGRQPNIATPYQV